MAKATTLQTMKKPMLVTIMAFFAVLSLLLTACGAEEEDTTIRIATNPWPGYEFLHLAEKKGFFKEEGVSVKLVRFSALEDARRAYERGQVDGMASTLIEVLQAYESGRRAKVILITDFSNGSDAIFARKPIKSVSELKGKKIGVEAASLSVFVIARALEKAGLTLSDVKLEGMNQLNMSQALLKGKIDAIHTYPPYLTNLLKQPQKVTKIFDSTEIPGEIVDIVSVDPRISEKRPRDVWAIRRAWDKAIVYAKEHPDEAYSLMAALEDINPEDFKQALQGAKILNMTEQKQLMMRSGTLERVILQVHHVLHHDKADKKSIQPASFIEYFESDE